MVASKRAAADPTRSSNENKRTCSGEGGTTESLVSETYVIATLLYLELACLLISLLSSAYEDVPSKAQSESGSRVTPSTSSDTINRGIALLNAHHGPFGDIYPEDGVWGGTKFFSCTGFFIDFDDECQTILTSATLVRDPDGSNKIVEGLKIKVLLPNNQSKEGTLKHCSLQYNVALVSVKNCRYVRHVNLEQCSINYSSKVVAVGRSFESGALMATRGARTCWSGPFDCEHLSYSTCKISKSGIGGPLVDIDGKFLGMNYYDKKMGTPFLYFDDLRGILQYFKTKHFCLIDKTEYRSMTGMKRHILEDNYYIQNRWILPDPSSMNEREREEERRVLASLHPTSSRRVKYAYTGGDVTVLK
ncbi:unnamed protein product [Miscanthus lutarioriparius]|uniref:Uncharacterized protein n=1 Tax=Miscanthus lutarioriparius TaxID=422564 RepID=A0A811PK70_9POAL|nr:unnamed protein product [Miscanthus lutarioriparius]